MTKLRGADRLPPDVREAFAFAQQTPLEMTAKDLAFFKGCVDRSGSNWKVPPPSARHLRLVRRLELATKKRGGTTFVMVVSVIDVSQLPPGWARGLGKYQLSPILTHVSHLVRDVLARMKIKVTSYRQRGAFLECYIDKKSIAKAKHLVEAHRLFIGDGPMFLGKVDKSWRLDALDAVNELGGATRKRRSR